MKLTDDERGTLKLLLEQRLDEKDVPGALAHVQGLPEGRRIRLTPHTWPQVTGLVMGKTIEEVVGSASKRERDNLLALLSRKVADNGYNSRSELLLRFIETYLGPMYMNATGKQVYEVLIEAQAVSWANYGVRWLVLGWTADVRRWHFTHARLAIEVGVSERTTARTLDTLSEMLKLPDNHPLLRVHCHLAAVHERTTMTHLSPDKRLFPGT